MTPLMVPFWGTHPVGPESLPHAAIVSASKASFERVISRARLRARAGTSKERLVEHLQDPPVLVRPAVVAPESVRLHGIHCDLPVLLPQLDEPLDQACGVLEVHVVVHH